MRITCECDFSDRQDGLQKAIRNLGLNPVLTVQKIQVQYEGVDTNLIGKIIELFENEPNHTIEIENSKRKLEASEKL